MQRWRISTHVMDAPLLGHARSNILVLINAWQATEQGARLALRELQSLHQFTNGEILLRGKTSRLMLEVAHH